MAKIEDATLKAMTAFLEDANKLVQDERVSDAYGRVIASMKLGYQNMADNEEKRAWLNYVLSDQSYRIGFYLWRHGLMTKELEDQLRSFELPENAIETARSFGMKDDEEDAELSKQHLAIQERRNDISVFQSILAGDDLETAKRKQEEFEKRQAQTLGQLNNRPQAPAMQ